MSYLSKISGRGAVAEEGFTLIELMVVMLIIAILIAIAIPTFMGISSGAGNRAAQSNLTNALGEVGALYQTNSATFAPGGVAETAAGFVAVAPEFAWVSGASGCSASSNSNCLSVQVVDVSAPNDGQGVLLADYSSKSGSCWYALYLESIPASIASDSGVALETSGVTPTGVGSGGTFYANKTSGVSAVTCDANWAATNAAFNWGRSYANPGTAA